MKTFSCGKSDDGLEFNLGGMLTLENAVAIRGVLSEELKRAGEIVLSLDPASEADVSFFQILCAAHRTALRENRQLVIKNILQAPLASCIDAAGFRREKGCSHDRDGSCLWTGGKSDQDDNVR
ncbi:MAG: STAS domain-containing protein [Nitrospirae bacterium]|nr:STAS domain-containing protein [Nitrospirota bacterium]